MSLRRLNAEHKKVSCTISIMIHTHTQPHTCMHARSLWLALDASKERNTKNLLRISNEKKRTNNSDWTHKNRCTCVSFFFLFSLHRATIRVYKCWLLEYWTEALVRVNKFNECVLLLNLRSFFLLWCIFFGRFDVARFI